MLEPIDFLHSSKEYDNYFLNPQKILAQVGEILDEDNYGEWSSETRRRFTLLNRLLWALSVLNTIDDYREYIESDITTFFLAFSVFDDIIDQFERKRTSGTSIFHKTLQEDVFLSGIVENKDDYKFARFIRSLAIAHTANTDKGDGFLKKNCCIFILSCIDTVSAAPTDSEISDRPDAFYFHASFIRKDTNSSEPIIFKVFIDELKSI